VHGSQGSAIITVRTAEGRTVRTVRRQSVQQEGGTISKEEVRTIRIVLVGTILEANFCAFIVVVCYLYGDTISQKSGCCLIGTCGQLKLVDTNF
jgi:hypothetical protein